MPINVFGYGAVQTAYVSYRAIDITLASQVLVWPTSYVDTPNVLAAAMYVTTAANNANTLTLPDARQASVGQNFIITNKGASAFDLLTSDGQVLKNIPSVALSNSYYIQLTDNSTAIGDWETIQFGAGTSQANAVALAGAPPGNGIVSIAGGTTLATNIPVQSKNAQYTVVNGDRANLFVWTGGVGTMRLPVIGTVPAGFYVSFNNEGGGDLTIVAVDEVTIDNNAFILVQPSQSLSIISYGTKWWTLGFGQNVFARLVLPIPLGGTGQVTAPLACTALLPVSVMGALAFFDGVNWVTLPPGNNNDVLTVVDGIPAWVAP